MTNKDLTRQDTHFAFGKNWASYAQKITRAQIDEAVTGLSRLLGGQRLEGKRLLDIGSGSGLHALAAFELGAAEVVDERGQFVFALFRLGLRVTGRRFAAERRFARKGKLLGRNPGFFGSGCDEYVYKRTA